MSRIKLGRTNIEISRVGLGCMQLSGFYGTIPPEEESIHLLRTAYEHGVNFFDTSDIYGPHTNEVLIGKAFKDIPRENLVIATKFGIRRKDGVMSTCGTPEYVREACQASLNRLGMSYIDLYYIHRVDPSTPIEDTIRALAELVREGKIRNIGISECSVETLRRAHAIHPIAAIQSEYSLFCLNSEENTMLETCKELGVTFVSYSPLGRGFLSGKYKSLDDLDEKDWRRNVPRYQGENWEKNVHLVNEVVKLAQEKGCTPSQIALAWVLQHEHVVTIPGTKSIKYLEENIESDNIELTDQDNEKIRELLNTFPTGGDRYPPGSMSSLEL